MLTLEPKTQQEPLLHLTTDCIIAPHKHLGSHGILAAMRMSVRQIMAIQTLTVGQKDNHLWHVLRKDRPTASHFGSVLMVKRPLISKLCGNQDLQGVLALQWDIANKQEWINAFEDATSMKVRGSGSWLADSWVLGASPDGLAGETDIIEVKYPFQWGDHTIEEAVQDKSLYLHQKEGGAFHQKEDHHYWHQEQGQLHMSGKTTYCFTIWTPKQCVIIPISRDDFWQPNVGILESFYKDHMPPQLV
ncbi:uncharacterized protein LOC122992005 [Thunnus albacares]|uniref:uncharacterized protein LOC122992005 n=1 Tax=Thunnus albacares TaxID=8236 RepID=UPI001CF625B2|nr:uncharacterized protein LOC122992005 [Thunnus albacares]XP_044221460.1 uncharacterized protein LOC122992005 [Thunnus albacares]